MAPRVLDFTKLRILLTVLLYVLQKEKEQHVLIHPSPPLTHFQVEVFDTMQL